MARTKLTAQTIVRTGLNPAYSSADGVNHHSFDNTNEHQFIVAKNASGSPINVVIDVPSTVDGLAVPDLTISVPATTGERWIGPFPAAVYNQADSGNSLTAAVLFSVSAATSVTVGVFKLPVATY